MCPSPFRSLALFAAFAASATTLAQFRTYSAQLIGDFYDFGDGSVESRAITTSGHVLQAGGVITKADGSRLQTPYMYRSDMNDWLQVVGHTGNYLLNDESAILWSPEGGYKILAPRENGYGASASAINDRGQIVVSRLASDGSRGYTQIRQPDGTFETVTQGFHFGSGELLSENGIAVLNVGNFNNRYGLFKDGVYTLYPLVGSNGTGVIQAVNGAGVAVGSFRSQDRTSYVPTYYTTPDKSVAVGLLSGYRSAALRAIDSEGSAFGFTSELADPVGSVFSTGDYLTGTFTRALAFNPSFGSAFVDDLTTNLPSGYRLVSITSANASGDLAGYATNGTRLVGVRLWAQPVPEPASLAALGLGALALLRRRKAGRGR